LTVFPPQDFSKLQKLEKRKPKTKLERIAKPVGPSSSGGSGSGSFGGIKGASPQSTAVLLHSPLVAPTTRLPLCSD
jgi:hypothetical protein